MNSGVIHISAKIAVLRAIQADECICRISEVTDWEAGGRCEMENLVPIFDMELDQGSTKVLVVMRRGLNGVALTRAFNRCQELPELPEYDDDRHVPFLQFTSAMAQLASEAF